MASPGHKANIVSTSGTAWASAMPPTASATVQVFIKTAGPITPAQAARRQPRPARTDWRREDPRLGAVPFRGVYQG
jgi:hypothetical protein